MTTIINNPGGGDNGAGSGVGMIIGVIIALALVALFFVYGLPALRNQGNSNGSIDVNVKLPADNGSGGGNGTSY